MVGSATDGRRSLAWCASVRREFSYQAEDGIRDLTVTGVQTCALPSSHCTKGAVMSWERCAERSTPRPAAAADRKSTRLNSSHSQISYAVFCLKKKKIPIPIVP